jgi:hypothetical protein
MQRFTDDEEHDPSVSTFFQLLSDILRISGTLPLKDFSIPTWAGFSINRNTSVWI